MKFGVFDHLDRGPGTLQQYYEDRLRIVEAYDRSGFYGYHVAEHHATPLGMAPSPSVFLSAIAQRTRRLRFGPFVWVLPLYHPLRMISEICMLDQMSGGRLEIGFGRGASPIELDYFGQNPAEAQKKYTEELEIVLKGLTQRSLTYKGEYYSFQDVPICLEPLQKPYPPIWYGVHATESARRAARRGLNIVSLDRTDETRDFVDAFLDEWRAAQRGRPVPMIGLGRFIVVAETDKEAETLARRAYPVWNESFNYLFTKHGTVPSIPRPPTYEAIHAEGKAIAGASKTVAAFLKRQMADAKCNYLVGQFAFGDLTLGETLRSIELFTREVMPALAPEPVARAS
jgi:alkanesulfonate monooxygenase SsuD/methylene tetrahydromethanopterin reductase-like flavin-dependent oxidoreductase (luciferase family)